MVIKLPFKRVTFKKNKMIKISNIKKITFNITFYHLLKVIFWH